MLISSTFAESRRFRVCRSVSRRRKPDDSISRSRLIEFFFQRFAASRASVRSEQASASHHDETFPVHRTSAQLEDQPLYSRPAEPSALQSRRADGLSRLATRSGRSASAETSRHQQQHGPDSSYAFGPMLHHCP